MGWNFSQLEKLLSSVVQFGHNNEFSKDLAFRVFLGSCRRQQAGDSLVLLEQESDAFGVGGVGLFAAAGLVGGVYGGV
jgi:hypothetical protein